LEVVDEATLESEFSLANENLPRFYSVDHIVPQRKREVKEERKCRVNNCWKDFEITQLTEGMYKHGKDYDFLELAVPTRTRQ
jgi:hypothetical protein